MYGKKGKSRVVLPVTWEKFEGLIKIQGLQASIFDPCLLELDYEGLSYKIRICEEKLYLETIDIRMDVIVGRVKQFENDIEDIWEKKRIW